MSHCVTSVTARVGGEVCQSRIGRIPLPVGPSQSTPAGPRARTEVERSSPPQRGDARTCPHRHRCRLCDRPKPLPHQKEAQGRQEMSSLWMMTFISPKIQIYFFDLDQILGVMGTSSASARLSVSNFLSRCAVLANASRQIVPLSAFHTPP